MVRLLNSSGLDVQILEAVPTVPAGAWGNPSWVHGSVESPNVSPVLGDSVTNDSGFGKFSLAGRVVGTRGSVLASFVVGAAGMQRTVLYLTDSLTTPTNRIVIGVDGANRPYTSIRDGVGVEKAFVSPTYRSIAPGSQVVAILSWDSTQAIDGTRFALLQVNRNSIPSGDWVTSPVAAWTSFQPLYVVLGYGVGSDLDFNGQILSCQISNDTVEVGAGGTFPTTRVFDRYLSDAIAASTT